VVMVVTAPTAVRVVAVHDGGDSDGGDDQWSVTTVTTGPLSSLSPLLPLLPLSLLLLPLSRLSSLSQLSLSHRSNHAKSASVVTKTNFPASHYVKLTALLLIVFALVRNTNFRQPRKCFNYVNSSPIANAHRHTQAHIADQKTKTQHEDQFYEPT
jgi:hypothetical protein